MLGEALNWGATAGAEGVDEVVVLEDHVSSVDEVLSIVVVELPAAGRGLHGPVHDTSEDVVAVRVVGGASPEVTGVATARVGLH